MNLASSISFVRHNTRTSQQKSSAEYAYKPAFFRANLHFATETNLLFGAKLMSAGAGAVSGVLHKSAKSDGFAVDVGGRR
jgi:hypothetical protein